MVKPIILTLDDEVQVSDAIERDLRTHFGKDYRIVKSTAPAEALTILERLKQRNDEVALLLIDQRMPDMSGVELLTRVAELHEPIEVPLADRRIAWAVGMRRQRLELADRRRVCGAADERGQGQGPGLHAARSLRLVVLRRL